MAKLDTFYIDTKPKKNGLFLVPTGGSNSLGPGREGHLGSCQDWIREDCSVSLACCQSDYEEGSEQMWAWLMFKCCV